MAGFILTIKIITIVTLNKQAMKQIVSLIQTERDQRKSAKMLLTDARLYDFILND